jgi:prephenate dehydratase
MQSIESPVLYRGAFHDIAARHYIGSESFVIRESVDFQTVLHHVEAGKLNHRGMMAIENTLFGSLMDNYQLISNAKIWIEGEVYLRIHQNLLALPGQKVEDLDEVYSHPIAIAQCRDFFHAYPSIKLVETDDTAGSALMIHTEKRKRVGAIASTLAADIYGLDILAKSIESNKANFTRFLALAPYALHDHDDGEKVSTFFTVDHQVGSLYEVLGGLADIGVNLTKIQSAPIIGKPWEYKFFVDLMMSSPAQYAFVHEKLKETTLQYKVLGRYHKGNHYED